MIHTVIEHNQFPGPRAIAFLLAQVGAHAACLFAERLEPLSLKPSDAGIIRLLGQSDGLSQQALASLLRMHPSRLVSVVDDLETRGLLKRQERPGDRRSYALHLTAKGRAALADIGQTARAHNEAMCAGLTAEERDVLGNLLQRIAAQHGLAAGVHPGYARPGRPPAKERR
jgi:DNA-binding MarR family transcriptional regulator